MTEPRRFYAGPMAPLLVGAGGVLSIAAILTLLRLTVARSTNVDTLPAAIFQNIEWIGLVSLAVTAISVKLFDRLPERRGITFLPPEARWWEYPLMGAVIFPLSLLWLSFLFGAFVLLPFVAPFKVVYDYTLSSRATITSAVVAIPLVFLSVSLAFALLYGQLCVRGWGQILKRDTELFRVDPHVGWLPSAIDAFYFSSSMMVLGAADGFEASGACRWVALVQGLVGKLLEIVIVAIGLTLVLGRTP